MSRPINNAAVVVGIIAELILTQQFAYWYLNGHRHVLTSVISGLIFLVAIVIGRDARRLGAFRGLLGGGLNDLGPLDWFFCVAIVPLISIPAYLITRPKFIVLRDNVQ
jgi:hypothetical protein